MADEAPSHGTKANRRLLVLGINSARASRRNSEAPDTTDWVTPTNVRESAHLILRDADDDPVANALDSKHDPVVDIAPKIAKEAEGCHARRFYGGCPKRSLSGSDRLKC